MKIISTRLMKRLSASILAVVLCLGLLLTGCGGGGAAEKGAETKDQDEMVGNYIPVVGEMMGVALTGDDLGGFGIELQDGGKAVMTVDGESHKVKWKSDESTVTITVDGEELIGERGQDYFVIKDMLGMGMDLTFAKEGTPAADPAQYLPEAEKFMLQDWQSVSVTDILGDPTDEIAPDALRMTFRGDHTMDLVAAGEEVKDLPWSNLGDYGSVDSEDVTLSWDVQEDGLEVDYAKDGTYYTFFCPKDPAAYKATADTETKESEEEDTEEETEAETETDAEPEAIVSDAAAFALRDGHGKAASSPYADYWDQDWYGWYEFESCHGVYEDLEGLRFDTCGSIFVEGQDTGRIVLWDEDGDAESTICEVEVSFGPGTTDAGCMKSESGTFLSEEENVGHADWIVDPGASDLKIFDHMIEIDGSYEDEDGSLRYYIYLKPWGMEWEDVREIDEAYLPWSYDNWYMPIKDSVMPDRIGNGSEEGEELQGVTHRIESFTVASIPEFYPAGSIYEYEGLLFSKDCYLMKTGNGEDGNDWYILDADTVLEEPEMLDGWEEGDDPLSWMERLCDEDSMSSPAGVYDITVTGEHIDIIHGLYWWD